MTRFEEQARHGAQDAALARVRATADYQALSEVDMVVEVATENFDVKGRLLTQIEAATRADAVIASNTSSLSITALGAVLADRSRFVGMHFFNPVPLMALVEEIGGVQRAPSPLPRCASSRSEPARLRSV